MSGSTLQVYYDMYEKSKEKYAVEMQLYSSRTKPPSDDVPAWCTVSNNVPDETQYRCVWKVRGHSSQPTAHTPPQPSMFMPSYSYLTSTVPRIWILNLLILQDIL
jgi:hypothetical protein